MTAEEKRPLIDRIRSQDAEIGVIGLGYVGVPLAIKLAEKGFLVKGIEKEPAVVDTLQRGKSLWPDVSDEEIADQLMKKNFLLVRVQEEYQNTEAVLRQQIADCDVYIICVPTPLKHSSHCDPDIQFINKATKIVEDSIQISEDKDKLVIVESTTYPGCTEEVILPRLKSALSTHSTKVNLAYSPERTNPGGKLPFWEIPKIVGGLDETSFELASELYKPLFKDRIKKVSFIRIAETVKCAENAYRFISISFANRLAKLSRHSGVDIWNIIAIMNKRTLWNFLPEEILKRNKLTETELFKEILRHDSFDSEILSQEATSINTLAEKCVDEIRGEKRDKADQHLIAEIVTRSFCQLSILFLHQLAEFCNLNSMKMSISEVISAILTKRFGLDLCFPGPGVGGHCIPIDPLYLYWKAREERISIPLIWEAFQIDEEMPDEIVGMVKQALHAQGRKLGESNILMLGVTYKENVPDIRESKALEILKSLLSKNVNLYYCDPVFTRRRLKLFPDKDQWMDRELYLGIKSRATVDTSEATIRFYLKGINMVECAEMVKKDKIDCVVIFANHSEFSENRIYEAIISNKKVPVIDTRNVVEKELGYRPENVFVLGRM